MSGRTRSPGAESRSQTGRGGVRPERAANQRLMLCRELLGGDSGDHSSSRTWSAFPHKSCSVVLDGTARSPASRSLAHALTADPDRARHLHWLHIEPFREPVVAGPSHRQLFTCTRQLGTTPADFDCRVIPRGPRED
jgi:hypothetical protein